MPTLKITAPYDGQLIDEISTDNASEIEVILSKAHALFSNRSCWIKKSQRIEILRKVAQLIRERRDTIAVSAAREGGKPLIDSLVEVDRAADGVECYPMP